MAKSILVTFQNDELYKTFIDWFYFDGGNDEIGTAISDRLVDLDEICVNYVEHDLQDRIHVLVSDEE